MLYLGKTQVLEVDHFADAGAYLCAAGEPEETVLLPNRYIPEGTKKGSLLTVFLYRDSEDRLIATTDRPYLEKGGLAALKVKEVGKIGAFLDWGLPRDLFLPYKETRGKLKPGQKVFVTLYIDKSDRLAASMYVDKFFSADSPYQAGDKVKGHIYAVNEEIGAFTAVDDRYFGLIPKQELYEKLEIGQAVEARVTKRRPDGRLNLTLRRKAYAQMDEDAEKILQHLEMAGGILGIGDKSDAALIKAELSLSKAAYKRAAGRLYKEGRIKVFDDRIEKLPEA